MCQQTALCSRIRVSQAGSLALEACILVHQWQCQLRRRNDLLHRNCSARYAVQCLKVVMLIIHLNVPAPSDSWRENTADPSSSLPGKTRLELCQDC